MKMDDFGVPLWPRKPPYAQFFVSLTNVRTQNQKALRMVNVCDILEVSECEPGPSTILMSGCPEIERTYHSPMKSGKFVFQSHDSNPLTCGNSLSLIHILSTLSFFASQNHQWKPPPAQSARAFVQQPTLDSCHAERHWAGRGHNERVLMGSGAGLWESSPTQMSDVENPCWLMFKGDFYYPIFWGLTVQWGIPANQPV